MGTSSEQDDEQPGRGAGGLPSVGDITAWGAAITGEVARLPSTISRARRVVTVLPEHLDALIEALDRFSTLLDHSLGEVRDEVQGLGPRLDALQASIDALAGSLGTTTSGIDQAMPALSQAVVRLEERLEGMDSLLSELGGTVVGTINAGPGLRRIRDRSPKGTPAE